MASVVEDRRLNGQPLRIQLAELTVTNRIVIMYEEPVSIRQTQHMFVIKNSSYMFRLLIKPYSDCCNFEVIFLINIPCIVVNHTFFLMSYTA